jgi:hypothetical protein
MPVARKWPIEVENAIGQAIIAGTPTTTIYREVLSGTLPGLERGYAMPKRTYWQTVARVRKRMREGAFGVHAEPGQSFIEQLVREEEDGFIAQARVKEREGRLVAEPEAIPDAEQDGPAQVIQAPALNGRDREQEREALLAKLEGLIADAEAREPAPAMTASEQRAATRAQVEAGLDGAARHARGTRVERRDPVRGPWISRD